MLLILSILPSLRRGRCAVQSRISPPLLPAKYSPISSKGGRPGSDISTCWTFARRARRISFFSGCTRVSQKQTSAPIKRSTSWRCLVLRRSKSFFKVEISTSLTLACNCKYGKTSPIKVNGNYSGTIPLCAIYARQSPAAADLHNPHALR